MLTSTAMHDIACAQSNLSLLMEKRETALADQDWGKFKRLTGDVQEAWLKVHATESRLLAFIAKQQ